MQLSIMELQSGIIVSWLQEQLLRNCPSGSIVGGVPARVIGTYESAKEKARAFSAPFLEKGLREPCTVEEMLHVQ